MEDENRIDLSHVLAPENQHEAVAIARALCPFAEQATDVLMLICVAMVEAKGDKEAIIKSIGLDKARMQAHLQSRLAGRIIKELAKHKLRGEGYLTAVSTLMDVAGSQSQTGNARNNAAKILIELAEADEERRPSDDVNDVDLNNMTLSELEKYVGAIKQDLLTIPNKAPTITDVTASMSVE